MERILKNEVNKEEIEDLKRKAIIILWGSFNHLQIAKIVSKPQKFVNKTLYDKFPELNP